MFGRIELAVIKNLLEIIYIQEGAKVQVIGSFGDGHAPVGEDHNVQFVQGFVTQKIDANIRLDANQAL